MPAYPPPDPLTHPLLTKCVQAIQHAKFHKERLENKYDREALHLFLFYATDNPILRYTSSKWIRDEFIKKVQDLKGDQLQLCGWANVTFSKAEFAVGQPKGGLISSWIDVKDQRVVPMRPRTVIWRPDPKPGDDDDQTVPTVQTYDPSGDQVVPMVMRAFADFSASPRATTQLR